jgi:sugar phosphate isomerase/epimerase
MANTTAGRTPGSQAKQVRKHTLRLAILCLLATTLPPHAKAQSPTIPNPFFAFEDGFGTQTPDQKAALAEKIGFDGVSFDGAKLIPERLKAVADHNLTLPFLYLGAELTGPQIVYEPKMEEAIAALKGRNTIIWLTLRGHGPNADPNAIAAVRHVSDLAAQSGLRVALYPHFGLYVQTIQDALRIALAGHRSNLGITFNLCHELRSGTPAQVAASLDTILDQHLSLLYAVSINGADPNPAAGWPALIQPLDRGSYNVAALIHTLVAKGYRGPIGLQSYAIPGDPETNLTRSMAAWRRITEQTVSTHAP